MKSTQMFGSILVALALAGCGAMPVEEQGSAATQSVDTADVASKSAAAIVTCPDPKSCGSWSSWYDIGTPVCTPNVPDCAIEVCRPCHCNIDGCDECCRVVQRSGSMQTQESFRDCRLQNGTRCREKREQTVLRACGC